MKSAIATFVVAFALGPVANAQVFRCTDAKTGKVTFSDRACASSENGKRVEVSSGNSFDGESLRQRAAQDRMTQMADEEEPKVGVIKNPRQQRREPASASTTARAKPGATQARPTPSIIVNCDVAGCWDNLGGRYNRGAGNTYIPAAGGAACQMIGGQMQCP
jgi:hypothetical protein